MSEIIRVIGENSRGTDYICSDIHGHFSLLKDKLSKIGFNSSVDRLFSLGDLIDRGPECEDVLTWLKYDWFYAIQGNHEKMLINAVEQKSSNVFMQWYAWGGDWAKDLDIKELEKYYLALSALPLAIELKLPEGGKVGLVHAELPDQCDWNEVVKRLSNLDKVDAESDSLISDMLWKKSQLYRDSDGTSLIKSVKNVDHVFHGHTIVDVITTYGNRTFMDLGSYLNEDIGLVNPVDFM